MPRPLPLALATCLLFVASCGDAALNETAQPAQVASLGLGAPVGAPAQAAEAFFAAVAADDEAGYEARMTPAAVEALHAEGGVTMSFSSEQLDSWTIGDETVDGDEAAVAVTVTSDGNAQSISLRLREHEGRWLVYGMALPMGDDEWFIDFEGSSDLLSQMGEEIVTGLAEGLAESMTEAFEQAASEWQAGGSAEEIAAARASYEALEAIDQAQHDAAWRVDLEAAGRPAAELIAELLAGTGLAMQASDLLEHASSLSLTDVSRLEAIEALCVEAGVVPSYPGPTSGWDAGPSELTFRAGTRRLPVAFAGPFMIEASELEERAPNSTGELSLSARALNLAPAVLAANQQMAEYLDLERIESPAGADLRADDARWMGSPTLEHGLFSYTLALDLAGLLRSVESLTVEGAIVIALPEELHAARFPAGPTDEPLRAGPWSVVWRQNDGYGELELTHADGQTSEAGVRFAPDDAAGEPLGIQSESASPMFDHVNASLSTPEAPAALAFKVYTPRELRYPFHLELPLEHFAEQPLRLEPLSFAGPAPLTVEFKRFADRSNADFPEVALRIHNPSNLDIESAQVRFEYLDAAGQALKDFPHNLTGEFTFEGSQPLVTSGQATPLQTVAFFMPPETAGLRVRVESVTFINGTGWERED